MSERPAIEIDDDTLASAAGWLLRRDAAAADDAGFARWIAASGCHRRAYELVAGTDHLIDELRESEAFQAYGHSSAKDEAAIVMAFPESSRWSRSKFGPRGLQLAAIAASLLLAVGLTPYLFNPNRPADPSVLITTGINERKAVRLDDRSVLVLDGASRVSVKYGEDARTLTLETGQARFRVARDRTRPFRVASGDFAVVATGTDFVVERLGSDVVVSLLEGRVSVAPSGVAPSQAVRLRPGDRLVARRAGRSSLRHGINLRQALGWQQGMVVLDNDLLADAVRRFERNSRTKIVIGDSEAAQRRISGVFYADDAAGFAELAAEFHDLRLHQESPGRIRLSSTR